MADVNSRDAVLDAIDEYEDIGQAEFLARYGGGLNTLLAIEYIGQRFAAFPTINLAHRILHGQLLSAAELTDEAAVHRQLSALGFTLDPPVSPRSASARTRGSTPAARNSTVGRGSSTGRTAHPPASRRVLQSTTWNLQPGAVRTRAEITGAFGGSNLGTVVDSPRTASILIFSDTTGRAGATWQGWDAAEDGVYHVTAAGRRRVTGDSAADDPIMKAAQAGRTLRLFEAVDEPLRPGGRRQRYLGAFSVDPDLAWRTETDHDAAGNPSTAIVFRLVAQEEPTAEG